MSIPLDGYSEVSTMLLVRLETLCLRASAPDLWGDVLVEIRVIEALVSYLWGDIGARVS